VCGAAALLCEIQGTSPGRRRNGGLVLGEFPYLEVEPKEVLLFCKYKKTLKGCPAPVL
jgi:hypothetical protein